MILMHLGRPCVSLSSLALKLQVSTRTMEKLMIRQRNFFVSGVDFVLIKGFDLAVLKEKNPSIIKNVRQLRVFFLSGVKRLLEVGEVDRYAEYIKEKENHKRLNDLIESMRAINDL